jgi:flagellar biosynthesis protein FlhB
MTRNLRWLYAERRFAHVHLQWFAAADEGRSEEPTEHKIRKAREEGKVAKSMEMVSALVLLFPVISIGLLASDLLRTFGEMMRFFLYKSTDQDVVRDGAMYGASLFYFARLSLPVMAVSMLAAVLGSVAQVGLLFTVKPITPDFSRIVPRIGRFFQRSLFSGEALFNFVKNIVKIAVIGLIAWLNIQAEFPKLAMLMNVSHLQAFGFIAAVAFRILVESAVLLLFLSLFDYMFQRRLHIESLKMSRQEIIEERKQYEGDPLVKNRLRDRMRQLLRRTMIQNVPRADVVVTNPTHFAVALEYKQESMEAPMLIAKGLDHIAENIKRVARENEVPVVENKPLARALYADVEIGDFVPVKYWEAVAVVIGQVRAMKDPNRLAG